MDNPLDRSSYADTHNLIQSRTHARVSREEALREIDIGLKRELREDMNPIAKGFMGGVQNTIGMGHGAVGAVQSLTGNKAAAGRSFERARNRMDEAGTYDQGIRFFSRDEDEGAFGSAGNFGKYMMYTTGQLAPFMAEIMLAGVVGGAAGSQVVPGIGPDDLVAVPGGAVAGVGARLFGKRVLREMIEAEATKHVARGITREVAERMASQSVKAGIRTMGPQITATARNVAQQWGRNVGAGLASATLESGGMWADMMEQGIDNPYSALALGTISGASEIFMGNLPLAMRTFFKGPAGDGLKAAARQKGPRAAAGLMWDIATDVAKNMGEEGVQEAFQEFLGTINAEINDPQGRITDKETWMEWAEASAAGAVGGLVFGAPASTSNAIRQRLNPQAGDGATDIESGAGVDSPKVGDVDPSTMTDEQLMMLDEEREIVRERNPQRAAEIDELLKKAFEGLEDAEFQGVPFREGGYESPLNRRNERKALTETFEMTRDEANQSLDAYNDPSLLSAEEQDVLPTNVARQNTAARGEESRALREQGEARTQLATRIDREMNAFDRKMEGVPESFLDQNADLFNQMEEALRTENLGRIRELSNVIGKKARNVKRREARRPDSPAAAQDDGFTDMDAVRAEQAEKPQPNENVGDYENVQRQEQEQVRDQIQPDDIGQAREEGRDGIDTPPARAEAVQREVLTEREDAPPAQEAKPARAPQSQADEIFIQPPTKQERTSPTAKSRRMAALSENAPDGYTTAYKPYGVEGAGFYYVKAEKPTTQEATPAKATPKASIQSEVAKADAAKPDTKAADKWVKDSMGVMSDAAIKSMKSGYDVFIHDGVTHIASKDRSYVFAQRRGESTFSPGGLVGWERSLGGKFTPAPKPESAKPTPPAEGSAPVAEKPATRKPADSIQDLAKRVLRSNPPQVAQPTILESSIPVEMLPGETVNGKGYALPGIERLIVVVVPPTGSKAKATASGWSVWVDGKRIYRNLKGGTMDTVQQALSVARPMLKTAHDQIVKGETKTPVEASKPASKPAAPASAEPTLAAFTAAFDSRDVATLSDLLRPDNKNLRAEWAKRTGEKLPPTLSKTRAAVEAWAEKQTAIEKSKAESAKYPSEVPDYQRKDLSKITTMKDLVSELDAIDAVLSQADSNRSRNDGVYNAKWRKFRDYRKAITNRMGEVTESNKPAPAKKGRKAQASQGSAKVNKDDLIREKAAQKLFDAAKKHGFDVSPERGAGKEQPRLSKQEIEKILKPLGTTLSEMLSAPYDGHIRLVRLRGNMNDFYALTHTPPTSELVAAEMAQQEGTAPAPAQEATPAKGDTPATPPATPAEKPAAKRPSFNPLDNLTAEERAEFEKAKTTFIGKILGSTGMAGMQVLDPDALVAGAKMTALLVKGGVRTFRDFATYMKQSLGMAWAGTNRYIHGLWTTAAADNPSLDEVTRADAAAIIAEMDAEANAVDTETETSDNTNSQETPNELDTDSISQVDGGTSPAGTEGTSGQRDDSRGTRGSVETSETSGAENGGRGFQEDAESGSGSGDAGDRSGQTGSRGDRDSGTGRRDRNSAGIRDRVTSENYRYSGEDGKGGLGAVTQARANVEAIRTMKRILSEIRPATLAEQQILAKYTGWGAGDLANNIWPRQGKKISDTWTGISKDLESILTEDEMNTARRSTQYAHWTGPEVVHAIYKGVNRLGIKGGRALESSIGIGNFVGAMPDDAVGAFRFVGIEMDSTAANIAKLLYPQAEIRHSKFEDVMLPEGSFDVSVGNPPFANVKVLSDKKYAKLKLSLHDYFLAKNLDSVRPGGVMAVVVSRYTMDKMDSKAREYLAERAELVGAIRLPQTAFKKNAGTEVVTDILFFKKREFMAPVDMSKETWTKTAIKTIDGEKVYVNQYFHDHPGMIIGTESMQGSMRHDNEYTVKFDGDIVASLDQAVERLPSNVATEANSFDSNAVADIVLAPENIAEGAWYIGQDGEAYINSAGKADAAPKNHARKIKKYIPVRDAFYNVLRLQSKFAPVAEIKAAQKELKKAYNDFVKAFGPLNKRTEVWTKKKITDDDGNPVLDEDGGQFTREQVSYRYPNTYGINLDPMSAGVFALEKVNEDTGEIKGLADIFTEQVVAKRDTPVIESPADAMVASLARDGRVDMEYIAETSGVTVAEAEKALEGRVFYDPVLQTHVASSQYLSGNVKSKLAAAEKALKNNPAMQSNVDALRDVIPADKKASEISIVMGSAITQVQDINSFLTHMGARSADVSYSQASPVDKWNVGLLRFESGSKAEKFSSDHFNATRLISDILNARNTRIFIKTQKESIFSKEQTALAENYKTQIRREFASWVNQNPNVLEGMVQRYNDNFNTNVRGKFDGSYLPFKGLSPKVKPHKHQVDVVARIVEQGNVYMAHEVGAGKTYASIMAGMEMKRMGLIKKPIYVVPNHMLEQFSREFVQAYPLAKVFAVQEGSLDAARRRSFAASVSANNWDGIVITHSAFKRIGVSGESAKKFIAQEITKLKEAAEEAKENAKKSGGYGKNPTVKAIEAQIERLENKLAAMLKDSDPLTIEDLGIDYMFVDEAHEYRKLTFATGDSSLKGVDPKGSDLAWNLYMKTRVLRERYPDRHITFMSGTPVTNTMGEMYSLMRFFKEDMMAEMGVDAFDAWKAMFAESVTSMEADASGKYKPVTRLMKFVNMATLSQMWAQFGDYVTTESLNLKGRPKLKDGTRQIDVSESSPAQDQYREELKRRLDAIENRKGPPEPGDDIVLSVITDGRHAAIDQRFIDPSLPADPDSKIERAIREAMERYRKHDDKKAAQMIFCDLGVPSAVSRRGFSVYTEIKRRLIQEGVPESEIAFMQDYKKHAEKRKLFARVNSGSVRFLIGSSKAMGTGVNAQERLAILYHIDAPWIPADMVQREGRIVRQGNQFASPDWGGEVEVIAYTTKGSMDETMWQLLETKQRMISQFLSGELKTDSMEDMTSEANMFALAKALTSNDPRILKLAELKKELETLRMLESAHRDNVLSARSQERRALELKDFYKRTIDTHKNTARQLRDDIAKNQVFLNNKPATLEKVAEAMVQLAESQFTGEMETFLRIGTRSMPVQRTISSGMDSAASWQISTLGRIHGGTIQSTAKTSTGILKALEVIPDRVETAVEQMSERLKETNEAAERSKRAQSTKFEQDADLTRVSSEIEGLEKELMAEAASGDAAEMKASKRGNPLNKTDGTYFQNNSMNSLVRKIADENLGRYQNLLGAKGERAQNVLSNDLEAAVIEMLEAIKDPWNTMDHVRSDLESRMDRLFEESKAMFAGTDSDVSTDVDPDADTRYRTAGMDGFYSPAARAVEGMKQDTFTAAQLKGMLQNAPGVKAEELVDLGLFDWLDGVEGGKVSKAEVLAFIDQAGPQVVEVVKDGGEVTIGFRRTDIFAGDTHMLISESDMKDALQEAAEDFKSQWDIAEDPTPIDQDGDATTEDSTEYPPVEWSVELTDGSIEKFDSKEDAEKRLAEELYWIENDSVSIEETSVTNWNGDEIISFEKDSQDETGDTKFGHYQIPGGENYREVMLMLPNSEGRYEVPLVHRYDDGESDQNRLAHVRLNDRTDADGKRTLFVEEIQSDWHQDGRKKGYDDASYSAKMISEQPVFNVVEPKSKGVIQGAYHLSQTEAEAFIAEEMSKKVASAQNRPDDFYTIIPAGSEKKYSVSKNGSVISEVAAQSESDAINKAKPNLVPAAPFKKSWAMLAFKRVLRMAAEQGYDAVAWTPGEVQNDRYDLSKQVDGIIVDPTSDGMYSIQAKPTGRNSYEVIKTGVAQSQLEGVIGKELAAKVSDTERSTFEGGDLKIEGEGMKGFYDKILPAEVGKYVKKMGGKVGMAKVNIGTSDTARLATEYPADMPFATMDRGNVANFWETRAEAEADVERGNGDEVLDMREAVDGKDVWSLPITDAMRSQIMEGQGLYRGDGDTAQTAPLTAAEKAEAVSLLRSMLGEGINVEFATERMMTPEGRAALGKYRATWITLAEGQAKVGDTVLHEAVHAAVDMFLEPGDRAKLLDSVRKDGMTDLEAEEALAENFIRYAKDRSGFKGSMKRIASKVLRALKALFGGTIPPVDRVTKFYDDLMAGKLARRAEGQSQAPAMQPAAAYRPAVSPEQDAAYMAAVEAGDTASAQRMVDEAAKGAGVPTTTLEADGLIDATQIQPYHGLRTAKGAKDSPWGEPVANRKTLASLVKAFRNDRYFGPPVLVIGSQSSGDHLKAITGTHRLWAAEKAGVEVPVVNLSERASDADAFELAISEVAHYEDIGPIIRKYVGKDEANLFDHDSGEKNTKSSDPVTYDDSGNVVPLSRRFNEGNADIRFRTDETPVPLRDGPVLSPPDRNATQPPEVVEGVRLNQPVPRAQGATQAKERTAFIERTSVTSKTYDRPDGVNIWVESAVWDETAFNGVGVWRVTVKSGAVKPRTIKSVVTFASAYNNPDAAAAKSLIIAMANKSNSYGGKVDIWAGVNALAQATPEGIMRFRLPQSGAFIGTNGQIQSVAQEGRQIEGAMYRTEDQAAETDRIKQTAQDMTDWAVKMLEKRPDTNARPDISKADKMFRTIFHYARKVPAVQRVFDSANRLHDNKQLFGEQIFGEGEKDISSLNAFARTDKAEGLALKDYLRQRDMDAEGYTVRESGERFDVLNPALEVVDSYDSETAAWENAFTREAQDYHDKGHSEESAVALKTYRQIASRMYDQLMQAARELEAKMQALGEEMPKVDGGDLFDMLRQMGDRRGHYMPRIRKSGRWVLKATKEGENPIREHFDTRPFRKARALKLEKQGYKTTFEVSNRPSEDAFLDASLVAISDMMKNTMTRMNQDADNVTLEDLGVGHRTRQYTTKEGEKVPYLILLPKDVRGFNSVYKEFGGQFFDDGQTGTGKAWHFKNPSDNLARDLARAMFRHQHTVSEPTLAFANAFTKQMAELIHSRGSRASKIARAPGTGKDVWIGYEADPFLAITRAGKSTAGGTAKRQMAQEFMKIITGTDVEWNQFREQYIAENKLNPQDSGTFQQVWEAYQKEVDSRRIDSATQPEAYEEAMSFTREMLRNESGFERIMGTIRGLTAVKHLSGVASGLVNYTTMFTVVPAVMNHYGNIPLRATARLIAKGQKDYAKYYIHERFGKGEGVKGEESQWLMQQISSRGWDSALFNEESIKVLQNQLQQGWSKATDLMLIAYGITERANRGGTIAGAYYGFREQGMSRDAALQKAKEISDNSHSIFGKANLPSWARGGTLQAQMTRNFYMYMSYVHNWHQVLGDMVKGGNAKATAFMLIAPAILAGPSATYLTIPIAALAKAIFGMMGLTPPDEPEEEFFRWVEETFGDTTGRFARAGVVGGLTGIDLRGSLRADAGRFIPTDIDGLMGAPYSLFKDAQTAVEQIGRGNPMKAAEALSPRMFQGPIRSIREATQGVTGRNNQPVFYEGEPLKASFTDSVLRFISFNPANLSIKRERQWAEMKVERDYSDKRTEIYAGMRRWAVMDKTSAGWLDVLNDVEEYNAKVRASRFKDNVPFITESSIRRTLTNTQTPNRRERVRAGDAGLEREDPGELDFNPREERNKRPTRDRRDIRREMRREVDRRDVRR